MIRIFQVAIGLDVPLALRTREQLGELAASRPELLREDVEAGRRFVELCCDPRDRANPSRLEQMQDLGLLAAIMPEWEPSTGRVQHDIYHVYTVDQHALYAVGRLHALQRGDHAAAFPIPTRDGPRGHASGRRWRSGRCCTTSASRTAARTARSARGWRWRSAAGWASTSEDTQRVEFLVRQHLVMGQMSQRRDLEDLGMISDFARAVRRRGEPARAVPADVLRSRRRSRPTRCPAGRRRCSRELYTRTLAFLRRGPDLLGAERAEIVAERQKGAARLLGEPLAEDGADSPLRRLFAGFPSRYFAENTETRIAAHVRLMRARREQGKCSLIDVVARHAPGHDRAGAGGRATRPACSPRSRACCTRTASRSSTRRSTRGSRPTRASRPRRWTCSACATAWAAR